MYDLFSDINAPGISPLKESKDYFWDVELLIDTKGETSSEMNKLKAVTVPQSLRNLDHYNYSTCYEKDALLQVPAQPFSPLLTPSHPC